MKTDRWTVQMVVLFIGLSGLTTIAGLIALAYLGRDIPEPLSTLGGAAIGALGTLLARTSTEERRAEREAPAAAPEVRRVPRQPAVIPDVIEDDGDWDEKQQQFYAAAVQQKAAPQKDKDDEVDWSRRD